MLGYAFDKKTFTSYIAVHQGCTTCGRKRIFSGLEFVLQNARCSGRALSEMFCYVNAKK